MIEGPYFSHNFGSWNLRTTSTRGLSKGTSDFSGQFVWFFRAFFPDMAVASMITLLLSHNKQLLVLYLSDAPDLYAWILENEVNTWGRFDEGALQHRGALRSWSSANYIFLINFSPRKSHQRLPHPFNRRAHINHMPFFATAMSLSRFARFFLPPSLH